jgi:hypothetical protein
MEEGFLFDSDRQQQAKQREFDRRSAIYGTPEFWQAYRDYIQSPQWKKLCGEVRERAKDHCEQCPPYVPRPKRLEVHHLTYDRFRHERLSDLVLLCVVHHKTADRKREEAQQQAFESAGEDARQAAGMNTYFRKKYGDDWYDQVDQEQAYEEWGDWKQRKYEQGEY